MREIVFTNANGVSITLGSSPILIDSITGLGGAPVSIQYQKAPYQDGSTYIDALMENRIITVDCTLSAAATLTAQYTQRATILNVLNPKLGKGTIVYTYAGGTKTFFAIPVQPVFPNKHATTARQKFQISFECCDPFAYGDEETVTLPTPSTGTESVVNGASSDTPSVIQLQNGNIFVAYKRNSDGFIVSRTYTTSWSSESVINGASSSYPCIIEKSNGNLFIAYRRNSDNYLVSRIYTSSWGAESVINSSNSISPSVIEKSNGDLFIVYSRSSDGYIVSRTYTSSWGSEVIINNVSSSYPSVIQKSNGDLFVVYRRTPDDYLVSRNYTTSWSQETVVNNAGSTYPSVIEKSNGDLFVVYVRLSDEKIVSRSLYSSTWSSESIIKNSPAFVPSVIEKSNGDLFITYQRSPDSYIVSVTRSVNPTLATNSGDQQTPCTITFNGPSTNPRIVKQSTLEQIRLNTTLTTGDTFTVSTAFGQKTVLLTSGGISVNGMQYLDLSSTFFQLDTGDNVVYYEDDAATSTATASLKFRSRYMGV
jgi:hypothetical protein